PPAVEVRTADVLSAVPADAPPPAWPGAPGDADPDDAAAPATSLPDSASAPRTFFGLAVAPSPPAPSPSAAPGASGPQGAGGAARSRARRWRGVIALAAIARVGGGGLALLAPRAGAASPGDTARRSATGPPDPGREIAARANELAGQGDREAALDL